MAKKQVIWSGSAKKDLYAALESNQKKYEDIRLTSLFFTTIERKIQLLRRGRLQVSETSVKNICSFTEGGWCFLFEEPDSAILMHNVSEL